MKKEQSNKWLKLYRKLMNIVTLLIIPKLLGTSQLIVWRNNAPHHVKRLFQIMKESLDKNHVFKGFKECSQEFIFGFHFGNIIKFMLILTLFRICVKVLPYALKLVLKILRNAVSILKSVRNVISKISLSNISLIVICIFKYGVFPSLKCSTYKSLCVYKKVEDTYYFGGVSLDKVHKMSTLHLISREGQEIEYILPQPLVVIPQERNVYICGSFYDENVTHQRKMMIRDAIKVIGIKDDEITPLAVKAL